MTSLSSTSAPRRIYRDRQDLGAQRYDAEERHDVLAFRRGLHGSQTFVADPDYVRWLYEDHPAAVQGTNLWLHRKEGRVVAQQGALPTPFKVLDRELEAAWAVEGWSTPELATRAVTPLLSEACLARYPVALNLDLPDENRRRALTQAGWIDLGQVPTFVRVLDSRRFLPHHFRRPLWRGLGAALDLSLSVLDRLIQARIEHRGVRMYEVDHFDARADELWAQVSPAFPLIARRDQTHLNWRFCDHPVSTRYRKFYFVRDDLVVGYAVLRLEPHGRPAVGHIVDYLCAPQWTWFVLGRCLRFFRRARMAGVLCVHQSPYGERALQQLGFVRKTHGLSLSYRAHDLPAREAALAARQGNWFITAGDGDVDRPRDGERSLPT